MVQFSEYYLNFLWALVQNIGDFFVGLFNVFKKAFYTDIVSYFRSLTTAAATFDAGGWVALILISLINTALIFFLLYRLAQVIRRFVVFRSKEVDKDRLNEEIARLKEKAARLAAEKSQIFALKLGVDTMAASAAAAIAAPVPELENTLSGEGATSNAIAALPYSRFTKLANLDRKYSVNPQFIRMSSSDTLALDEIVERFRNFAASQLKLYYEPGIIRQYFAGMGVSKVIILEGISGTGKTSLPYAVAKFFENNATIVSVQPSWRDRAELVGYFNEFTKKFNETDFLAALYETTYREDMNFIILDEMNLARIEYYFAEFLSIMEMPNTNEWKIELVSSTDGDDPKNLMDGKLTIPQNQWFVGTANQDDSTFTITDKVYDRAVALSINNKGQYFDAPMTESITMSYDYLATLFEQAGSIHHISEKNLKNIDDLDNFLQTKFKICFGNRIMRQINQFTPIYMACGGTELEALDFMLTTKILRKLAGLNLAFLANELKALLDILAKSFGKDAMPTSVEYIKSLQKMI